MRPKIRRPFLVFLFNFFTLGLYGIYWWYAVNSEMAELGKESGAEELGDNPELSALAWAGQSVFGLALAGVIGGLSGSLVAGAAVFAFALVPAIWTLVTTCQRIRRTQTIAGLEDPTSPGLFAVVWIVLSAGGLFFMQWALNRAWWAMLKEDTER
jgi:hypothetical protein